MASLRSQSGRGSEAVLLLTFEAGSDMTAPASSASSFPKTGMPSPLGQPRTTQVTTPPHESPRVRTSSIAAVRQHCQGDPPQGSLVWSLP